MTAAEPQASAQSSALFSSAMAVAQAHASILSDRWNTTPADASRLESDLVGDPHNVGARTRLISYYYQKMIAEPRTRHIFWLIENHTGSVKYRETPVMRLPAATPAAAERMKNELETSKDASLIGVTGELLVEEIGLLRPPERDTPEMINSAGFGKRLLERARSLEPGNPRWRQ